MHILFMVSHFISMLSCSLASAARASNVFSRVTLKLFEPYGYAVFFAGYGFFRFELGF